MKPHPYLIILSIVLLTTSTASAWDYYPLGGGNAEKILLYNSTNVKGAWFFDKDGGTHWIEWDDANDHWESWQSFDAYHCWHMGGDVYDVGSTSPLTPTVISVGMQGHQLYTCTTSSPYTWSRKNDLVKNDYFYYHDAQFYKLTSGYTDENHFLVSTWQLWKPYLLGDTYYRRGLFVVQDGQNVTSTAAPATDTGTHVYGKIHADLEDRGTFYTWGDKTGDTFGFWKIQVAYDQSQGYYVSSMTRDFSGTPTPEEIDGFYQYVDTGSRRHQYLLVGDGSPATAWYIWHRKENDQGNWDSWTKIWDNVQDDMNDKAPWGLAADEYDAINNYSYVYTFAQNYGLAIYKQTSASAGDCEVWTTKTGDDDVAFPFLNSHTLTRTPASWPASGKDMILVSTVHAGNVFAEVDRNDQEIDALISMDDYGATNATPHHANVRWVYEEQTSLWVACWGIGVFKVALNGSSPVYGEAGLNSTSALNLANFNFNWNCIVASPFSVSNTYYLGAAKAGPFYFKYDSSPPSSYTHTGLYTLNVSSGSGTIEAVSSQVNPPLSVNCMVADDAKDYLYFTIPDMDESDSEEGNFGWWNSDNLASATDLCVKTSANDNPMTILHYTATQQVQADWLAGPSSVPVCPDFLSLAVHPNPGLNPKGGIVYGMGLVGCDWAGHCQDGHTGESESIKRGGSIGIAEATSSGVPYWATADIHTILGIPHGYDPNSTWWFENPFDLLVEYNSGEYGTMAEWKRVDILAATGAWEIERGTEEVFRYGGLFRITPTTDGWTYEDITPYKPASWYYPNPYTNQYKLDGVDDFQNPAVLSIDMIKVGTANPIYMCITSGEAYNTQDDHKMLLWYQQKANMRSLTKNGWYLFPNPGGAAGMIPYKSIPGKYFTDGTGPNYLAAVQGASDNWVAVGGTNINKGIILGNTPVTTDAAWGGEVRLADNVTINSGAMLTLKPDCKIVALGEYSLILDSAYIRLEYPDSNRVLLTSAEGVKWGGLIVRNMHPDSTLILRNLEVRNAEYGVYADDNSTRTVKLVVENCIFDNCGVGVGAREANRIKVKNCEIKNGYKGGSFNGDGIYFFSLSSNGTHAIENCIIHHNDGCGIRLSSCPSSLILYNNDIHDNLEQNTSAYSSWAGVYCYNSSPKIRANEISESHGYPLATFNSSAPYLCKGPDSTNVFELAMTPPDTYAVILADAGFPVMNSAYNNFSHGDCDDDLLIDDLTNPSTKRKVAYNWWGVNPPVSAQFSPSDSIDYNPYLTSAESFPTGLPSRGPYSGDLTAYDLLDSAIADYYSGDYSDAYWTLCDIIENHATETEVVCMALPHLLQAGPKVPVSLAILYDYFDEVAGSNGENLIGKTARKVGNDCLVMMTEYQDAINDYQTIISDPPTLSDSVFAILDANQANLIMSGSGMPGTQSMAPASPLNPVTFQEYMKREAALLAMITQSKAAAASSGAQLPMTFALHQNFPNPFNPATTIRYDLPEISHVKISIYNMLGQKVVTLVDRTVEAGYQRATWDMSRSGNALASGLYIYQIVAEGKETGKTFVTAKKMLMIK